MKSKNTYYITLINVISCISVVFLHSNGVFWRYSTARYWKTANIIETFFYFAVPCFFMISGATLMDFNERYSLKEYFIKRIKKTVIPFLIWSIIGFLYYGYLLKTLNPHDYNIKDIFNGIMNTSFVSVYWFFPHLFITYLGIPLFAAVDKEKRKKIFSYLAICGFILNACIPFVKTVFMLDISFPINLSVVSGSLLYVVIGYLISEYEMSSRCRKVIYLCSVIGFLVHLIGTYIVSTEAGEVLRTYKGYYNMMPIMHAVGVFVWLKYNSRLFEGKLINKIVGFISSYTFGIYLIHRFILDALKLLPFVKDTSIYFRLGAPIIIIIISVFIIFIIRKIPMINTILFP